MYFVARGNPIGESSAAVDNIRFNSIHLSYIDLSECQLDRLPSGLPRAVRYLQLRRNRIARLDRSSLAKVDVSILVLDDCSIEEIEPGTFANLTRAQQIWLNGNQLRTIPRPLPAGLERLFVDTNLVENITGDDFPSALTSLSMMGNRIANISSFTFRISFN